MKIATAIAALALVSAPSLVMAAPGSCERVKSDIEQRIINNGVPADNFTLTIVPIRPGRSAGLTGGGSLRERHA